MSENRPKRKNFQDESAKLSEKNSEIWNSEKFIEISVHSLTSNWHIILFK